MTIASDRITNPSRTGGSADKIRRIISRRSFCTLATASVEGSPHVVGILYKFINDHLYLATGLTTRKARNIEANPKVAVHIPVRQYPVGPPFSVQFTGTAKVLSRDDPEIISLLESGKLKNITGFGVLKEPDLCFLKVKPSRKIHTYGIGIPLREFLRSVAHADRTVVLENSKEPAR